MHLPDSHKASLKYTEAAPLFFLEVQKPFGSKFTTSRFALVRRGLHRNGFPQHELKSY